MNYTVIILRLCYLAFGLSASSNGPSIKLTSISESVKIANQCVCVCVKSLLLIRFSVKLLKMYYVHFALWSSKDLTYCPLIFNSVEPLEGDYKCCLWKPRKETLLRSIILVFYHCSSNRKPSAIFIINIQEYNDTMSSPWQWLDS